MQNIDDLEKLLDDVLADLKGSLLNLYVTSDEWQTDETFEVDEQMVLKDCKNLCKAKFWVYYDEVI